MKPRLEIEYCAPCNLLMRAGWTAQELLNTFLLELGEVALIPGSGGIFDIRLNGELIFSKKAEGRFPEMKELKLLVRDKVEMSETSGSKNN